MGLGDEIMALGRAEALFEQTGKPVSICRLGGYPRTHEAWWGNPAWDENARQKILDGGGCRPYIKHWDGRRIIFNEDYRARAGRMYFKPREKSFCAIKGPYAVVAPSLKDTASINKDWGVANWEAVIKGFPIPVYQLTPNHYTPIIKGAKRLITPTFRIAAAVIAKASLVMCNEGGSHHMAASVGTPAVVIFGSFISPKITGYDIHRNISVETSHGFCGKFDYCPECAAALKSITPEYVRHEAGKILG